MRIVITVLLPAIVAACGQKTAVTKAEGKVPSYNFGYAPYDAVTGVDRQLYNYLFNILRNKMLYYAQKTFPVLPEPVGLVLELQGPGTGEFEQIMQRAVRRGWTVFETDVLAIPADDIEKMNAGWLKEPAVRTPKTSFSVRQDGSGAVVFVRYWMLQYWNYNFIYHLRKTTNWTVVRTETLQ